MEQSEEINKNTDSFLDNECMGVITGLAKSYPNDMEFGKAIRKFISENKFG